MKRKWDQSLQISVTQRRGLGKWIVEQLFESRWASKVKIYAYYKTMKVFFYLACISTCCWRLPKPKYEHFITHFNSLWIEKSCMLIINYRNIKTFLTSNCCSLHNITFSSEKVISSESGETFIHRSSTDQVKTVTWSVLNIKTSRCNTSIPMHLKWPLTFWFIHQVFEMLFNY